MKQNFAWIIALGLFAGAAQAESNKGDVRRELAERYEQVIYGGELDEIDYVKCAAAVVDGGALCLDSLQNSAGALGTNLIIEAFRHPGRTFNFAGRHVVAGFAVYNNTMWTKGVCPTITNPLRGCEWKTKGPNSFQPYIGLGLKKAPPPALAYSRFAMQTGTALGLSHGKWDFMMASNGDLISLSKHANGTHSTEVHVLSASSGYGSFSLQTGTPLHETGDSFEFLLAPNRDIYAISKNQTGSGRTEVHVLSAASNYQAFSLQTGTALHQTGADFQFMLAPNLDIIAMKKAATGSGTTEVHVLTAASQYQEFGLQTPTALHETGSDFEFVLAPNRDILAIKKMNGGSHSTEVHILSAASNYTNFSLQSGTALHMVGDDFRFVMAPDGDLVAIAKGPTGTGSTELHKLAR